MATHSYGFAESIQSISNVDNYLEEIRWQGFTIIPSVFEAAIVKIIKEKIKIIYAQQEKKVGKEMLREIGDENICRCPMAYDIGFIEYAINPIFMEIAEYFLGNYFILSVQNANLSQPKLQHVQSAWHRDLPYQNFTTSKPLALNFLVAIDDFTLENGGLVVLPFSHKMEELPSKDYIQNNAKTITAKAGDVISFDSMLIHRAGVNTANQERFSFNHMYTRPFIKQQYDFASIMKTIEPMNPRIYQISGISSRTALDDVDWRNIRKEKINNR